MVSAQVSRSERKPAPLSAMASTTLSRSRVDRANLSRRLRPTCRPQPTGRATAKAGHGRSLRLGQNGGLRDGSMSICLRLRSIALMQTRTLCVSVANSRASVRYHEGPLGSDTLPDPCKAPAHPIVARGSWGFALSSKLIFVETVVACCASTAHSVRPGPRFDLASGIGKVSSQWSLKNRTATSSGRHSCCRSGSPSQCSYLRSQPRISSAVQAKTSEDTVHQWTKANK